MLGEEEVPTHGHHLGSSHGVGSVNSRDLEIESVGLDEGLSADALGDVGSSRADKRCEAEGEEQVDDQLRVLVKALPGGEGRTAVDRVRKENGKEGEGRGERDDVDEEHRVDGLGLEEEVRVLEEVQRAPRNRRNQDSEEGCERARGSAR